MKTWLLLLFFITNPLLAQHRFDFKVHSHNDYLQNVPFWKALAAGASSIEVDVFLVQDALFVAHSKQELDATRTFEKLYLDPLTEAIDRKIDTPKNLQLLIDVKTEAYSTLNAIVKSLQNYPIIVDNQFITIVISGNRPAISDYTNYPEFIFFDHQSLDGVTEQSLRDKIALVSLSFTQFSKWNGKGRMTTEDLEKVVATIAKVKKLGKPFRFWATPDSKTAWRTLVHLGMDFINTDTPFECTQYLSTLNTREYANAVFSPVYLPTFVSDGKKKKPKNIILLIGDGNGLAQISAAAMANKGELTLTQLQSIGFLKTASFDDPITDSAAGATAIATGSKVPNRAIGVDFKGQTLKNITEILVEKGFQTGIITPDEITGATPAAFYAHQKDRSMDQEITNDLATSKISVFVGGANTNLYGKTQIGNFEILSTISDLSSKANGQLGVVFDGQVHPSPLSSAVKNVLAFFTSKNNPFFLMVEGAKIDSYAHENNIGGIVNEGISFDQAITEAIKFADSDQNTLVIIAADHETGGLAIAQGHKEKNGLEGDFTTDDHTGIMVPIFAYGPRSPLFQGVYENNTVFTKILKALDIDLYKN